MMTGAPKPIMAPKTNTDVGPFLTTYFHRDDREWTIREYDYRLRWSHRGAFWVVEVWGKRDSEWHEVWAVPANGSRREGFEELARKATSILLGVEDG